MQCFTTTVPRNSLRDSSTLPKEGHVHQESRGPSHELARRAVPGLIRSQAAISCPQMRVTPPVSDPMGLAVALELARVSTAGV